MNQFKIKALASSAIISGTILLAPLPAFAQGATPAADEVASEEIIVTARKRSEDIQTVPISITAFTAEDLAQRNISNFNDLTNTTPGVAITSISGGNVQQIFLRGLAPANTANDLNVEANVGVFIDGIYQTSRNTLDIISVLDLGQIEIAKGPQSALFGRSTFAGALAISTKRPSRDFEGSFSATAGVDKDYRVKGTISAPIANGLYARVAGGYLTYGGFGKNSAEPSNNLGGTEKYAVNASLEYAPSEDLTARLSGFVTHSESELSPTTLLPIGSFNCGAVNAATGLGQLYCGSLPITRVSDLTAGAPKSVTNTRQISLDINWKLDGVSITSVTGFTSANNRSYNDYDGTGAGVLLGACTLGNATNASCGGNFAPAPYTRLVRANALSTGIERVNTFSQEIRLQSDNKSPFEWLLGANYFDSQIPLAAGGIGVDSVGFGANERFVTVPVVGAVPATGLGGYEFTANPFTVANSQTTQVFSSYSVSSTVTFGIFGSVGYKFGNLRVNAEGRYNTDRKRAQVFSVANAASVPGIYPTISGTSDPAAGSFPVVGTPYAKTFSSFTPRFSVDYQATPDIFLYATAAKGVRSGGFNTGNEVSATGYLPNEVAYDEETNWTYEAGIKSRLFGQRLLLNASVFHVDWTNAQISTFTQNPTARPGLIRIVQNLGNIKTTGFEVQADLTVARGFVFGGSVTYSDPKFQQGAFDSGSITQCVIGSATPATATAAPGCPPVILIPSASAVGGVRAVPSLAGLIPQRAVKLQWNLHATASVPLSDDWRATGRVDVTYTGPTFSNLLNTTGFGERTLTNLRVGVENNRFGLSVWANNVFDKAYVSNSINQPRIGAPFTFSIPEIYLGEGRRVGVTGSVKF